MTLQRPASQCLSLEAVCLPTTCPRSLVLEGCTPSRNCSSRIPLSRICLPSLNFCPSRPGPSRAHLLRGRLLNAFSLEVSSSKSLALRGPHLVGLLSLIALAQRLSPWKLSSTKRSLTLVIFFFFFGFAIGSTVAETPAFDNTRTRRRASSMLELHLACVVVACRTPQCVVAQTAARPAPSISRVSRAAVPWAVVARAGRCPAGGRRWPGAAVVSF